MADKTIRFITAWNGYKPGDTLTDDEAITDELVAGGLATEDLVGPSGSYAQSLVEHAAAHSAMASWGSLTSQVNALAVLHLYGSGAPVDYTDGTPPATGEGTAPRGAIYSDINPAGSGFVYRNSGSQSEPIWTKLADAV